MWSPFCLLFELRERFTAHKTVWRGQKDEIYKNNSAAPVFAQNVRRIKRAYIAPVWGIILPLQGLESDLSTRDDACWYNTIYKTI